MNRRNPQGQSNEQVVRRRARTTSFYSQMDDLRNAAIQKGKDYRNSFFEMYGSACSCCGEPAKEFLTIRNKNSPIGARENVERLAYEQAILEYRPELYEVICWNCSLSKERYGYCPHKKES